MLSFVFKKIKRLRAKGFTKHDINWLPVYDNWPSPKINLEKSSLELGLKLREYVVFESWQRIFIHRHEQIVDFTESNTLLHQINNIWCKSTKAGHMD